MKTWSPENPFLYDLEYKVIDKNGKVVDEVEAIQVCVRYISKAIRFI